MIACVKGVTSTVLRTALISWLSASQNGVGPSISGRCEWILVTAGSSSFVLQVLVVARVSVATRLRTAGVGVGSVVIISQRSWFSGGVYSITSIVASGD